MIMLYQYEAIVVRVIDADSIVADSIVVNLDHGFDIWSHALHVRLADIDAPEKWTLPGKAARDFVLNLLPAGTKTLVSSEKYNPNDKFGRCLATIVLSDGRVLNDLLVEAGHAVPYSGGAR